MTSSNNAIEVRDLRKVYHQRRGTPVEAVRGISFDVPRGSIFGLLGPNGAGKTTTIKILTTLLAPTSGTARVMGHDVVDDPLAVRRVMVAVMQDNCESGHVAHGCLAVGSSGDGIVGDHRAGGGGVPGVCVHWIPGCALGVEASRGMRKNEGGQ